jgi:glutathione S-transferase
MAETFTLYGVNLSGPTYKVALMLTLSGQRFEFRPVDLQSGVHRQPAFLALNRYGQVPALVHGKLKLCQSGAILEYLSEILGKFGGRDVESRARIREWMFWDADSLSPGIYRSRAIGRGFVRAEPAVLDFFRRAGEAGLSTLERHLGETEFLIGSAPTIADIACYGATVYAPEAGYDLARWPKVIAWMCRMVALPHFRRPDSLLPTADAA